MPLGQLGAASWAHGAPGLASDATHAWTEVSPPAQPSTWPAAHASLLVAAHASGVGIVAPPDAGRAASAAAGPAGAPAGAEPAAPPALAAGAGAGAGAGAVCTGSRPSCSFFWFVQATRPNHNAIR